ncbi:hypothetical protein DFH07DRAFT_967806 [Mycena maculata]|uniref:Uncharacterized protein n=1 Tax=Mycena maculata TaxID=230809 RepID=A0AAD7I374_9AGAR|nr:hypothetical protein DFH07DRAFT_967806 [Mycena maculata]
MQQQQAQYAHQHIPASFDMRLQSRPMRTDRAALRAPHKPTRPRPLRLRHAHAAVPLRELRLGRGVTPIPTGNAINISLIIVPITDVGDISNIDIPMLGVGNTDIPIPPAELGDIPIAAQHFNAIPAHLHSKRAGLGLDECLLMGGMGMGMKYPKAAAASPQHPAFHHAQQQQQRRIMEVREGMGRMGGMGGMMLGEMPISVQNGQYVHQPARFPASRHRVRPVLCPVSSSSCFVFDSFLFQHLVICPHAPPCG